MVVVRAFQPEARRHRVAPDIVRELHVELPDRRVRGVAQREAQDELQPPDRDDTRQEGARDRAGNRRHDQEQPDPHVAEPRPEVRCGGAARRGDDRDDAGPHRVVDVDAVEHGEDRDQQDAAAQPQDRAHHARAQGREEHRQREEGEAHGRAGSRLNTRRR